MGLQETGQSDRVTIPVYSDLQETGKSIGLCRRCLCLGETLENGVCCAGP